MRETSHVYELIVIGGGPAGITAAIYAARKKMDLVVLTVNIGGQVVLSSEIENYTGFQYITGEELTAKFKEHLERHKFELKMEKVQEVEREKNLFRVKTDDGAYLGRTAIIATGRRPRELNVLGESKFKNRGVTYCATCDAPLFEGLDVAVVGGGNSGLEAVLQLIKIAKSIHLIEVTQQLRADSVLVEKAKASEKVEIWTDTRVVEIVGDKVVSGVKVQRNGKETLLPVQGVFVEIGSVPNSEIVKFVEKNQWGEIIVNSRCETNIPGLFAAGDVTNVPEKQIVVAAGEGCKAALSAFRYLSRR
ncbi:MAG: NAD(P)/FAD-dependent oxidoreductase [Candidatus Bathyarchaeaceae archaeon]